VGMSGWANTRISMYSKGMQQRVGLAQALVNDPELILLDEPTDGLDPVGRREVRGVLKRLRDEGKTVFLNSHLLSEVEQVCDRVAILAEGQVVRQGTLEDLTSRGRYYEIELHGPPTDGLRQAIRAALPCELHAANPAAPPRAQGAVTVVAVPMEKGKLPTGQAVELDGNLLRIHTDQPAAIQPVIDALRRRDLTIHSVQLVRQSLEDFFIETVADLHNGRPAAGSTDQSSAGEGDQP
jgi:ABC-2 type transport system ATP-binding protein